jgi:hypothetical protein
MKRSYASKWWYRLIYKEVKQLVRCPYCGEYTSYSNHFVPRFFGNGDVRLNHVSKWSVCCEHCESDISFKVETKIERL